MMNIRQETTANMTRPRRRKRPVGTAPAQSTVPKATLVTSLLWLVAFTTANPSGVKAFVLASDICTYKPTATSWNKKHQPFAPVATTTTTPREVLRLFSALAEVDTLRPDLMTISTEERAEDVLDLSSYPTLMLLSKQQDRQLTKIPDEEEVLEWAGRYTSVEALREHFGTNENKLWGDLQASTARRLYKTLLPKALLELSKLGQLHPQDLAPLAYQARVAAKLYARERCTVPARLAATLFDGFRQWIKYGKFQAHGMSYQQLWKKYEIQILLETESDHVVQKPVAVVEEDIDDDDGVYEVDEECEPFYSDCEDLSEQVCRKILERACVSNEGVDSLALRGQDLADETELQPYQRHLLDRIRSQLERDMYQLLLPPGAEDDQEDEDDFMMPPLPRGRLKRNKFRLVKGFAKRRRSWKLRQAKKRFNDELLMVEKHWRKSRPKLFGDDSDTVTMSGATL